MNRSFLPAVVASMVAALPITSALAQGQGKNAFDGRYVGESAKCFPASSTYHFDGLTITNGSFSWTTIRNTIKRTCRATLKPDGTFETASDCVFKVAGAIVGPKAKIKITTEERECDIVAKRQ